MELGWERREWIVGKMMREKERGRRKRTERARKWREWALMMRFDSEKTPLKLRVLDEEEVSMDQMESYDLCCFSSGSKG